MTNYLEDIFHHNHKPSNLNLGEVPIFLMKEVGCEKGNFLHRKLKICLK